MIPLIPRPATDNDPFADLKDRNRLLDDGDDESAVAPTKGGAMGKLTNKPTEVCAYRHCNNEFKPKREAQRFCSQRCRDAYRYDIKRAEKGAKKARKRRLGSTLPGSAEKGAKTSTKTVQYKEGVDPYFVVKGFGIETPSTSDLDPELVRYMVRLERGDH